jgi:Family of unknown function (DUF6624)
MRCAVVDKPAMWWTWISRSRPSWPEWRPRISASGRLPPIPPNSCGSCRWPNVEAARIDVANTDRLRAIIAEHGWPGRVLVGDEGAEAAWLIAQHADSQLDFQREALALLERAVHDGDAPASHLAYLTDRVRMNEGRPQLFGTQVADWRSRAVPRAAVLLIPVFVLVDFILQQGLAGHAIQFIAATWIAWVVLRAGESPAGATPAESPIGATPTPPQV